MEILKSAYKLAASLGCFYAGQTLAGVINEPFAGASGYSVVTSSDVNLGSGVQIHGGAYIGEDLSENGDSTSVGSASGRNAGAFQNPRQALTASPMDRISVAAALEAKASQLDALADTGITVNEFDWNLVRLSLTADTLNVINWNSADVSFLSSGNADLMFENFTADTLVIVNY